MVTHNDIHAAIDSACRNRETRRDVIELRRHQTEFADMIFSALEDGTWESLLYYREVPVVNNNGKKRICRSPNLLTLVLQHLANLLVEPLYKPLDNDVGLNCKPEHGITSNIRRYSVVKRCKHIYYDRRDMNWAVIMDQRECYAHIRKKMLRKALKGLTDDKWLIDFVVTVSFAGDEFPVGTPTSPMMHHIIMLTFDKWLKSNCPLAIRYADDVLMPFATKEEAQQMLWRVKNFWWYVYGLRAKRFTQRVVSLDLPTDFCGYRFHRNPGKSVCEHDKGYVNMRYSIYRRALRTKTSESYASYYGLMRHADMFGVMLRIEKNMNLRELTQKIRIDRKLDAEHIDMKDLAASGQEFTIYDYDIRCDARGEPNWIKCLIGIPETNLTTGEATGKILAREFHGGADAIVRFHVACEKAFGKQALLPMTGMILEQKCGYIYQGSTNMLTTIEPTTNF